MEGVSGVRSLGSTISTDMKRVLAGTLAGLLAVFVWVTPAHAAETTACNSGRACLWEDANKAGERYAHHLPSTAMQVEIDWWDGDNEISSVYNRTSYWLILWDGDGWVGDKRCIPPGHYEPFLGDLTFNDKAESFSFQSTNPCA